MLQALKEIKDMDTELKSIEVGKELEALVEKGETLEESQEAIYAAWKQNKGKLAGMDDTALKEHKMALAKRLKERKLTRARRSVLALQVFCPINRSCKYKSFLRFLGQLE
jgi:hypothetical protein